MSAKGFLLLIAGLGILLMLAAFDHWLFTSQLNTTHLKWYLKNGALIGLVTAVVSLSWGDTNKHTGLLSAHPFTYLGACLQLVGVPIFVLGTHLRRGEGRTEAHSPFDAWITVVLVLILTGMIFIWLIVVVPLQYFIYLICGAPARFFSGSRRRAIACLKNGRLDITEIGKEDKTPEGWWDASLASKPVAITNLFQALLVLILNAFVRL
jgi:hypothetical protein